MTDYGPRYMYVEGRGYLDTRPVMTEIGHYLTEEEVQTRLGYAANIPPPEDWYQWVLLGRQERLGDWCFVDGEYYVIRPDGPELITPQFPEHWSEMTKEERMGYLLENNP